MVEILNKFKIFEHHRIVNFSSNIDLRKQDILSQGKNKSPLPLCKQIRHAELIQ